MLLYIVHIPIIPCYLNVQITLLNSISLKPTSFRATATSYRQVGDKDNKKLSHCWETVRR